MKETRNSQVPGTGTTLLGQSLQFDQRWVARLANFKLSPEQEQMVEESRLRTEYLQREREAARVEERRKAIWRERGERYRGCTLDNYQVTNLAQQVVIGQLREYKKNLVKYITEGVNIVLVGPVGTGKDHLLSSLFEPALVAGRSVVWSSGVHLFSRFRDTINQKSSEESFFARYCEPDVLAISDPSAERDVLTENQREVLYRIVDDRYNALRPVWASINAAGRDEAAHTMGQRVVDRLRGGALSLACDWASFRAPRVIQHETQTRKGQSQ